LVLTISRTIGTRLLGGRVIEERDRPGGLNVAVINETFVRRFFPNEDPIGQHFGMTDVSHSGDYKIVGIVEDAKYQDTRGPAYATFFLPLLQTPPESPFVAGSVPSSCMLLADRRISSRLSARHLPMPIRISPFST